MKMFMKKHSSTILTCIGAIGVVATAVFAVKATPKAIKAIEVAEEEKGDKLTKKEVVKCAAPAYIPAAVVGASTVACIFGANVLNKRQQASIASAYAFLSSSYSEYKKHVVKTFGEDADDRVKESIVANQLEDSDDYDVKDGEDVFFEFDTLQPFVSSMQEVQEAIDYVNAIFAKHGRASLSDFHNALGIENDPDDFDTGWSESAGNYLNGPRAIDWRITKCPNLGKHSPCYVVESVLAPLCEYY